MADQVAVTRESRILKTSYIGIITNIILGLVKALVGVFSGSIALVTDSLNNLSDAVSSIITIVGTKLAGKAPTAEHPFGYGRIEYMTALVIGIIVFMAGIGAAKTAIDAILQPEAVDYSAGFVGVVVITMIVKVLLGNYTIKVGEAVNSGALKAAGIDAKNDALVSAVTILSALIYFAFDVNIDAYAGALISLAVIKAGYDILKETISSLLGERVESQLSEDIYKTIRSYPWVKDAHDLLLSNYGPDRYLGSVHIEVEGQQRFADLYPMIYDLERSIYKEFNAVLTVGYYAVDEKSHKTQEIKRLLDRYVENYAGVIGYHGICIFEDRKEIFFDVTFAFGSDVAGLMASIKEEVEGLYPGYRIGITSDFDVADGEYE